MNVLVTGAGGFVGQHLVKALLPAGHIVTGGILGDQPPGCGILTQAEWDAVRWVPLDITSDDQIEAAVEGSPPGLVFHLAGQSSVGSSFRDELGTWDANATGTLRLLVALARAGREKPRMVMVSSAEVYGQVPEAEQPIDESRAPAPLSPYGASKLAAEEVTLAAYRRGMVDPVIVRSFNHTGPGQSTQFALASWAEQLAGILAGRASPRLSVGNLQARRDWSDVRDVVRAYLLLAERGTGGEIYNVCSGMARSLEEVARSMIEISGAEIELVVKASQLREVDIPLLEGDPGRLRALGWGPAIPFGETLRDLLDFAAEAG